VPRRGYQILPALLFASRVLRTQPSQGGFLWARLRRGAPFRARHGFD